MSQTIVRKAFESRLKAWADAQTPAIPVAWQNVAFTPPAGRYARAFLLPATTESLTLDKAHRKYEGILQVSLCMVIGTGSGVVEALVSSLDAYFDDHFTEDGLRIYLLSPMSAAPALQDGDRYVVPVSASYRADTV